MRALNCEQPAALKECASINQFTNFFLYIRLRNVTRSKGLDPLYDSIQLK